MYSIGQEEIEALKLTVEKRDFFKINNSLKQVQNFELEWSDALNVKYSLLMTSGFAALVSGLVGLGIGPGDEVIVPAYTYIATATAVLAVGAIPVIVDVDDTLTMSVEAAEKKITKHTKALLPVHIQGFPSDMDGLKALAKKYNLSIIEDACQSIGGKYHEEFLGTIGDVGAFSFNVFKIITCGEGGALVTHNRKIYERGLIYHDCNAVAFFGDQLDGINEPVFGGNEYRVSDFQGAILREQLKKLPQILSTLRENKKKILQGLKNVKVAPSHDLEGDCGTTVPLRFDSEKECRNFVEKCKQKGIGLVVPYDTGKHVYTNWKCIMEHRGSHHPALDPFKMKENKGLQMDYSMDMCAKSLELLARTAYLSVKIFWDDKQISEILEVLNS